MPTPPATHLARPQAETNLGQTKFGDRSILPRKINLRYTFLICFVYWLLVMRFPRVKAQGRSFYHCISRFVHGLYIFGTSGGRCAEAEDFLSLMRRWAALTGIRIRKYVLMANHFHLLCEVPEPKPLTQNEVLERIEAGYGSERVQTLRKQLAHFAQQPDGLEQSERLLDPYRQQMKSDLSFFMKQLKGCFAQQYNRRHKRHGTLWSERFKSVLLEGGPAVAAIAAYIDLNPVRAGLCEDPKDYRYCDYAEAIAKGSATDLEAMRIILNLPESASPEEVQREYRKLLYLKGAAGSTILRPLTLPRCKRSSGKKRANCRWGNVYGARFVT
jgi:REP element-mobilizing transposase RayT